MIPSPPVERGSGGGEGGGGGGGEMFKFLHLKLGYGCALKNLTIIENTAAANINA